MPRIIPYLYLTYLTYLTVFPLALLNLWKNPSSATNQVLPYPDLMGPKGMKFPPPYDYFHTAQNINDSWVTTYLSGACTSLLVGSQSSRHIAASCSSFTLQYKYLSRLALPIDFAHTVS